MNYSKHINYKALYEWSTKTEVFDNGYSKMKASEKQAYNYLLGLGYKMEHIFFDPKKSPDFKTLDGKGWEVKTIWSKNIIFTAWQSIMDMDTIILIVNNDGTIIEKTFRDIVHCDTTKFDIYGKLCCFDDAISYINHRIEEQKIWSQKYE